MTPLPDRAIARTREQTERFRDRFELSWAALALVAAAVAAVGLASAFLAKVAEDVIARDGLEVGDAANLQSLDAHRSSGLVDLAGNVTRFGSIGLLVVAAVVIGVVLWLKRARLVVAATPLLALLSTGAVVMVLKQAVGRARPPMGLRLVADTEPSFPSGHSADSAAVFVAAGIVVAAVVFRRPLARLLAVVAGVAASGLIGLSRLVLGAHWPTDVLAGWALGTIVAVGLSTAVLVLVRATPPAAADGSPWHRGVVRSVALLRRQRPGHAAVAT